MGYLGYGHVDFWRMLLKSDAGYDRISPAAELAKYVAPLLANAQLGRLGKLVLFIWLSPLSDAGIRTVQVFAITLNLLTFYGLVRILSNGTSAIVAIGAFFSSVQFRMIGDPFLSNLVVFPVCCELVLAALYIYVAWRRSAVAMVVAAILMGAAAAVIPAAGAFVVALAAAAWLLKPRREAAIDSLVMIAVTAVIFVLAGNHRVPLPIWQQFLSGIVFPIPGAYRAGSGLINTIISGTDRDRSFDYLVQAGAAGGTLALLTGVSVFVAALRTAGAQRWRACLAVFALIWLAGAAMSAPAGYFASFGFAGVCGALFSAFAMLRPGLVRPAAPVLGLCVFLLTLSNARVNASVLFHASAPWRAAMLDRVGASDHLFDRVPARSHVVFSSASPLSPLLRNPSDGVRALKWISGKRFESSMAAGVWILREHLDVAEPPSIDLMHAAAIRPLQIDKGLRFVRLTNAVQQQSYLAFVAGQSGVRSSVRSVGLHDILVQVYRVCNAVSEDSFLDPELPEVLWGSGFYPLARRNPLAFASVAPIVTLPRQAALHPWRYARARATADVGAGICSSLSGDLRFVVYSGFPGTLVISDGRSKRRFQIDQSGKPADFPVTLARGRSARLTFTTSAPRVTLDTSLPRYEDMPFSDIHMLVWVDSFVPEPSHVR